MQRVIEGNWSQHVCSPVACWCELNLIHVSTSCAYFPHPPMPFWCSWVFWSRKHVLVTSCPGLLEVLKMTAVEDQPIYHEYYHPNHPKTFVSDRFYFRRTFSFLFIYFQLLNLFRVFWSIFSCFSIGADSVSPKPDGTSNRNTSRTLPHHPVNLPTSQNKTDSFQPQVICYLFSGQLFNESWTVQSSPNRSRKSEIGIPISDSDDFYMKLFGNSKSSSTASRLQLWGLYLACERQTFFFDGDEL